MPLRLYLYATLEAARKIAATGEIRLSLPSKTNDVTECVVKGETKQSDEVENYGYICLSGNCTSPAMWGYYAGKSTGVCFVFDIPIDLSNEELERGVHLLKPQKSTLCKVKYTKRKSRKKGDIYQILSTKSPDWNHEDEYRLIFRIGGSNNVINREDENGETAFYEPSEMWEMCSGVILGARVTDNIAQFKANIQNRAVVKAKESPDKFSFEIDLFKIPAWFAEEEENENKNGDRALGADELDEW